MAYDEDLANRIRELLADEDGVSEMTMFGGLAFLLAGNMAVSASGQGGLLVRVDPVQGEELISSARASPFKAVAPQGGVAARRRAFMPLSTRHHR